MVPEPGHQGVKKLDRQEGKVSIMKSRSASTTKQATRAEEVRIRLLGPCLLLCLPGVFLPCCREGSGDGGGFPSTPVPFEQYCESYAQVTCNIAERCDCLGEYSVELCRLFMGQVCKDEVEDPVDAGYYDFDPVQAGRCLAALDSIGRDCSTEGDEGPESCDLMLVGRVEAEGSCEEDEMCKKGQNLECIDGRCQVLPGQGEACLLGYACADGLFCGSDDICHPYQKAGGSCPDGDIGCDDDLYCDERTWTCQPYIASGQSCSHAEHACDDDLYCDSRTYTCQPFIASGQSCSHAEHACDDDLYCSEAASYTCRSYPSAGQSCADSWGTCVEGSYCDQTLICRAQLAAGNACTEDEECLSYDCSDDLCQREEDEDDICSAY